MLSSTIEWLTNHGYRLVRLDAANWENHEALHDDFAASLDFPGHYGRNLDALYDCMRDVGEVAYGWNADDRGLVLVLEHYNTFQRVDPETAHAVLEVLDATGRLAALFGNRVLCLVQSDDPQITFQPVGTRTVDWNPDEWRDSWRGD